MDYSPWEKKRRGTGDRAKYRLLSLPLCGARDRDAEPFVHSIALERGKLLELGCCECCFPQSFGQRSFWAHRRGAVAVAAGARLRDYAAGARREVGGRSNHVGPGAARAAAVRLRLRRCDSFGGRVHRGSLERGKKRRILDSRVQGTRHLAEALAEAPQRPRVLITASAIGYYGDRGDEVSDAKIVVLERVFWPRFAARGKRRRSPPKRSEFAPRRFALGWCSVRQAARCRRC